jgi:hypothetical protein
MARLAVSLAMASLLLLASERAEAFCRSTTCRAQNGKECPTDANGCPTDGAKLWWPTSCISYATNKLGTQDLDPADTRAVIKKCFENWTDVKCPDGTTAKMTFQELDPVDCKKSQYNKDGPNVNVVLFQDDNWIYHGIDGTLAKTSVTYNDETGEIYDADIEVNTANNTVTITDDPAKIEYDLESILTHEVGHFIGLAHSPDPAAVMFASYSPGSTGQRRLHPDDVAAICTVYPHDYEFACNTEPRNGFSGECPDPAKAALCSTVQGGGGASYEVAGLLGLASIVSIRSRRRRRGRPTRSDSASGGEA